MICSVLRNIRKEQLSFYGFVPGDVRLLILFISPFLLECKLKVGLNGSSPLELVATLPAPLNETSGLAGAGELTLFTHNDSGNPPILYQVSAISGQILESFRIPGVQNIDWEELASDSGFIYIGDIGNNAGYRKDLVIYAVNKLNVSDPHSIPPGAIRFSYPEQTSFHPSGRHNFDCEAMIAWGDSLYLFTKNRKDLATDVYRLPKTPGNYEARHVGHFDTGGLITAADLLTGEKNQLALLGYKPEGSRFKSFLLLFTGFRETDFFGGTSRRTELANDLQAEAVLFTSDSTLLISNEKEFGTTGQLFRLVLKNN